MGALSKKQKKNKSKSAPDHVGRALQTSSALFIFSFFFEKGERSGRRAIPINA